MPVEKRTKSSSNGISAQPAQARLDARREDEYEHDDQVEPEVEQRLEGHRQRDHEPWEAHLAQEVFALDQ